MALSFSTSKAPPQRPRLILPYNPSDPNRYIFSFSTRRVHHLVLPQLLGKKIHSTANGWMLLADLHTKALSLLNPVSLAHIQLPPNPFFEKPHAFGYLFHDMFDDSFMVLCRCIDNCKKKSFIKVGDESWSELDCLEHIYEFIGYYRGKFFGISDYNVYTHDAGLAYSDQPVFAGSVADIPGIDDYFTPFATANGELFIYCDRYDKFDPGECIFLYKLGYDGQQVEWSKVQSEDYAVFQSVGQCILCCVKDFPEYKENCAYTSWRVERCDALDWEKPVIGVFNSKDGTSSFISCGWERPYGFNERPIWITPNFY